MIILSFILAIALFLRIDRILDLMMFIGDQGWFYLSARDILLTGNIPLVGIASSHPWLHQGPIWTYLLSIFLFVFNFNPIGGVYLSIIFGIFSIVLIFKIGNEFFSREFALLSALFYAASPLVIYHDRMAFHTSPIPFFVLLLFYSILKWINGRQNYFPIIFFSISMLYNFHVGTVVFFPIIFIIISLRFIKNKKYFKEIFNKKIILISLILFLIPLIPIFIYDFLNGFPQTLKYMAWFFYKFFQFFGIFKGSGSESSIFITTNFFFSRYRLLTVSSSFYLSTIFFFFGFFYILKNMKKENILSPINVIFFLTFFAIISFFLSNVPSEAYLLMLFPGLILIFIYTLDEIFGRISVIIVVVLVILNIYYSFNTNYLMSNGLIFKKRLEAANRIIKISDGNSYNLLFKGDGEEFDSSIMNYEYLTWWLGHGPSKQEKRLKIYISESDTSIHITKK